MQVLKLGMLSVLFTIVGCATNDDPATTARESSLEDRCNAPKSEFSDYDDATECAKSNPAVFQTALGALVSAGATCTATDRSKECTSIEPIKDPMTEQVARLPIRCEIGFDPAHVQCCVTHHYSDGPSDYCWWRSR